MTECDTAPPSWHLVHLALDSDWRTADELAARIEAETGRPIHDRTVSRTLRRIRDSDEGGIEFRRSLRNGSEIVKYRKPESE